MVSVRLLRDGFELVRGLWRPPADRRLAAALAAQDVAPPLAPAAPGMPPRVALQNANEGAAQRRRIYTDEQRNGVRTPWQPVGGLHWRFEDMEPVWQHCEIGDLRPVAQVTEAMRSEGTISGLMDVRCAFLRKPLTFQGDPFLCSLLGGQAPVFDRAGRLVKPGRKGIFRRMHPTAALTDLLYTGLLAGVACAEYVDDPKTGLPVLQTRDLYRLRYDWGERCWKYLGEQREYVVDPGNGRWVLFMPKSTHRPWRSGSWLPLMLAFVVMIESTYDAARFAARSADPLKWIEVPDEAPPDEVDRYEDFVQNWWERAPGIVLRWGAKAGITETNGIGHQIYGDPSHPSAPGSACPPDWSRNPARSARSNRPLCRLQPRQPVLLLLLGTIGKDWIHHQRALHADEAAQAGIAALEFLHDQAVFDVVHAGAAVAFQVGAEKTQPAHLRDQFARETRLAEAIADQRQHSFVDELARGLPHQ